MSDFVAAKTFTFAPRKNIYFSVQQKNYVFAPRKKKFAAPPQKFLRSAAKFARKNAQNLRRNAKFCFAPQNLRAKTRKTAQTGLRITPQKMRNCAQKKFCAANCAICAEAKIPENGNPTWESGLHCPPELNKGGTEGSRGANIRI